MWGELVKWCDQRSNSQTKGIMRSIKRGISKLGSLDLLFLASKNKYLPIKNCNNKNMISNSNDNLDDKNCLRRNLHA